MSRPAKDFTGLRYGRLTILRPAPDWGEKRWWCRCDCGTEFVTDAYSALYVGGIYPQTIHENPRAPLRVRVLLIGDSFARPVEAFLSVAVPFPRAVTVHRIAVQGRR